MHFFIHCSVKFILDRLSGSSGGFFFSSLSVFSFEGVVQFNVVFEEEFEFYIIVFHERLDFLNGLFVWDKIVEEGVSLKFVYEVWLFQIGDCVFDKVFIDTLAHG